MPCPKTIDKGRGPGPVPVPLERVSRVATIMHGLTLSVNIIISKIFKTNTKVENLRLDP